MDIDLKPLSIQQLHELSAKIEKELQLKAEKELAEKEEEVNQLREMLGMKRRPASKKPSARKTPKKKEE